MASILEDKILWMKLRETANRPSVDSYNSFQLQSQVTMFNVGSRSP
jgi:hypothetical protein